MDSYGFSVFDVAEYFLSSDRTPLEWEITHLKLQKLIYYAQGCVLGVTGRKLFNEPLEAWRHGPVCRVLYDRYKGNAYRPIARVPNLSNNKVVSNHDICAILNAIWEYFGRFSGPMLEELTHQELPWLLAIEKGINTTISSMVMQTYFSELLSDRN